MMTIGMMPLNGNNRMSTGLPSCMLHTHGFYSFTFCDAFTIAQAYRMSIMLVQPKEAEVSDRL